MSELKWEPEKLKEELIKKLVANGTIVGKFLEGEARRRLLDVREPEWGTAYRQQIVSKLVTSTVVQQGNETIIRVGVGIGPSGKRHGLYIELGSKTAPPQPFLRPAVFENASKIVALLAGK